MIKSIIATAMMVLLCAEARAEAIPESVRSNPNLCFETGDGEYKSYLSAKCTLTEGSAYECTFDNGDPETECFTHDNGCFVCAGMD